MDWSRNRPLPSGTRRFLGQGGAKCQSEQGVKWRFWPAFGPFRRPCAACYVLSSIPREKCSAASAGAQAKLPTSSKSCHRHLQDKMLSGSGWPVITPDRWLSDLARLEIRDEIRPKVLKANARKLLGISSGATFMRREVHGWPMSKLGIVATLTVLLFA